MGNGHFGEYLKGLRRGKDLTQAELGKLCDCTKSNISQIEDRQGPPSVRMLRALAGLYKLSLEQLLDGAKVKRRAA